MKDIPALLGSVTKFTAAQTAHFSASLKAAVSKMKSGNFRRPTAPAVAAARPPSPVSAPVDPSNARLALIKKLSAINDPSERARFYAANESAMFDVEPYIPSQAELEAFADAMTPEEIAALVKAVEEADAVVATLNAPRVPLLVPRPALAPVTATDAAAVPSKVSRSAVIAQFKSITDPSERARFVEDHEAELFGVPQRVGPAEARKLLEEYQTIADVSERARFWSDHSVEIFGR